MAYEVLEVLLDPEYDPGSDWAPIALRNRSITPQRRVREVQISSGRYHKGSVSYTPRPEEIGLPIENLWNVCTQGTCGCLFWDQFDNELDDELIGVGDGDNLEFQLKKAITIGSKTVWRRITRPVHDLDAFTVNGIEYEDTIVIKVDGVVSTDWTLDKTTGLVTFDEGFAPDENAEVTASGHFLVPIWFTDLKFPRKIEGGGTYHIGPLGIEEIVVDEDAA